MIDAKLVAALATEDASERRLAAQEIGESGGPEALAVLIAQLRREQSRAVKDAILTGISECWKVAPPVATPVDTPGEHPVGPESGSVNAVIELLKDDDPFVRAEASAMLQHHIGEALEGLGGLMRGGDRDLRKFCVDIFGQTSASVPGDLYMAALEDEDVNVVLSAMESIAAGRHAEFVGPVLKVVLEARHPAVVCAGLEALAVTGSGETLHALRARFPDAATVDGLYLSPFLKLLGHTAGPGAVSEICRVLTKEGAWVHSVAVDALTRIAARNSLSELDRDEEDLLLGILHTELEEPVRFRVIRLLGHFTRSVRVAGGLLPFLKDTDRALAMAAAESLAHSSDPAVDTALRALLETEQDPDFRDELTALLQRRPSWN